MFNCLSVKTLLKLMLNNCSLRAETREAAVAVCVSAVVPAVRRQSWSVCAYKAWSVWY